MQKKHKYVLKLMDCKKHDIIKLFLLMATWGTEVYLTYGSNLIALTVLQNVIYIYFYF